jgi:cyclopropane-fatty-acyl-phospholipid synthase
VGDGPFDVIASIGMAEHVGEVRFGAYSQCLYSLLSPGGRLLNHQIAGRPGRNNEGTSFVSAYVFPDGELLPLATTLGLLEEAGFEVRDVESLREHYALTLRQWVANLLAEWDRAVELTSPGRARVWQLYMAGSALAFEAGRIGVNQVLAVRPGSGGDSGLPPTREEWLGPW